MGQEAKLSKWALLWIILISLASQLLGIFLIFKIMEVRNFVMRSDGIFASEEADSTDLIFINNLKDEAGFGQDINIIVGPYKKLYGDNFKYRLEKHLVFIEQAQSVRETFLILFDKSFYYELSHEQRKGVLAHEMWHIFNLSKGLIRPRVDEEKDADNYSIRYVSIDVISDLCRQYEGDKLIKKIRIENMERQRLLSRMINPS